MRITTRFLLLLPVLASSPIYAVDTLYYYHNDHLGTPQMMTDESQAVVWQADYRPFGEVVVTTATIENNLRFPGQYYDQESGLHYNYFRDYDPSTGRYTQSDPIGLAGGINTYGYVGGNPIKFIDPSGLATAVVVNGTTSSNPFGHTAMATTGSGVYSFGNSTPLGSSLTEYLNEQSPDRNNAVMVINTTPEQEQAINDYLMGLTPNLPPGFLGGRIPGFLGGRIPDPFDTCATRTSNALDAAGLIDPFLIGPSFPTDVVGQTAYWQQVQGGYTINIPQGGAVPSSLSQFNVQSGPHN